MFKHTKSSLELRLAQAEIKRLKALVGEMPPQDVEMGEEAEQETIIGKLGKNDKELAEIKMDTAGSNAELFEMVLMMGGF